MSGSINQCQSHIKRFLSDFLFHLATRFRLVSFIDVVRRRHGCLDLDLKLELDASTVSLCPSVSICNYLLLAGL